MCGLKLGTQNLPVVTIKQEQPEARNI